MRVLYLAHHLPWPVRGGWQQRVFHLAQLAAERHDVHFMSFVRAEGAPGDDGRAADARELRAVLGAAEATFVSDADCAVRTSRTYDEWSSPVAALRTLVASPLPTFVGEWQSEALVRAVAAEHARRPFDVAWASRSWMAEQARRAGLAHVVVNVDDIVSDLRIQELRVAPRYKRKPLHYAQALKGARYERRLVDRFSHVVVAKEEDRAFFGEPGRDRVSVVPNGVVVPETLPAPTDAPDGPTLLFVGMLSYPPNVDAIRWMTADVLPRIWARDPRVRFAVAGSGDPGEVAPLLGDSRCSLDVAPADLASHYAAATLVVAPLRIGGGTRIKVLEAPARGRALVATRFAATGLDLRPDVDVAFADTAETIATRCLALLADPAARARLADAGRARVRERYAWEAIGDALERALVAGARARAAR